MRLLVPILFIILFTLAVDLYLFKALRLFCRNIKNKKRKRIIYCIHWSIPLITIIIYLFINARLTGFRNPKTYPALFNIFGIFILIYLPKIIFLAFHLLEDISFLIVKVFKRNLKRYLFLSKTGLIISVIPIFLILHGMLFGKYDFQVKKEKINFHNLPVAFNNLRIVQISDLHIGSFGGDTAVIKKIVDLVNKQNPDIIFFTGDLVNNFAEELKGIEPIFSGLKAKYGKYSILGNHDYGDYFRWNAQKEKEKNLDELKSMESKMGFRLLLNSSDTLAVNGQSIAIIGIENWGKPPFKQYGDLEKAGAGTEKYPFKILLSHDPDFWRQRVTGKTNIDFTLSGHTHGMQIGFHLFNKQWSPAKLRFNEWSGLYKEKNQYLYVNVGAGFIGLPARIGMSPEITVIELYSKCDQ